MCQRLCFYDCIWGNCCSKNIPYKCRDCWQCRDFCCCQGIFVGFGFFSCWCPPFQKRYCSCPCGIGLNLCFIGLIICPSKQLVKWSKQLNMTPQQQKERQRRIQEGYQERQRKKDLQNPNWRQQLQKKQKQHKQSFEKWKRDFNAKHQAQLNSKEWKEEVHRFQQARQLKQRQKEYYRKEEKEREQKYQYKRKIQKEAQRDADSKDNLGHFQHGCDKEAYIERRKDQLKKQGCTIY